MQKVATFMVLAFVTAALSLTVPGCASHDKHDDHPHADHPHKEHPHADHPKSDHPE